MMIEHDNIHIVLVQPLDGVHCGGTAIHRHQQSDGTCIETARHPFAGKAVAFIEPVRQMAAHTPSIAAQGVHEKGRRGHAIHIVIAIDNHAFAPFPRQQEPFNGFVHVRQQKRIAEMLQARIEKGADFGRIVQPPVQETLRQQRRYRHLFRQTQSQLGLRGGG